jgi:hypothetical protein
MYEAPPPPAVDDNAWNGDQELIVLGPDEAAVSDRAGRVFDGRIKSVHVYVTKFAVPRVHVTHRDYQRSEPRAKQPLLSEWPATETESTRYWLSNPPANSCTEAGVAGSCCQTLGRISVQNDVRELTIEPRSLLRRIDR